VSLLKRVADLVGGRRNWRETSSDWRSRGLVIVDAGSFDHPSYLPIKALEDALEATGLPRISNSSALERIWSRAIIRFDLTRFYVRLTRRTNFIVIMNLPARRFYPQGWWSETIVYCFDCWSGRYDEWELFLQRNRIRIAFFSARDAACELSRRLPGHTIAWMPEAIDAAAYSPARPLVERSIDLLEFGRSWPRYHQQIGPHCKGRGYAHRFPADGKLLFPTQEELHRGLADAKLVVCVPQSVSHPEIAGSTETMSLRYLEVIASGAIPLGRCPKEMHDLFGYNPVIEIDEADPEGQLDRLLARIDELAGLRERNLETLLRVATWERRAPGAIEKGLA
jgi:hypothetical protein